MTPKPATYVCDTFTTSQRVSWLFSSQSFQRWRPWRPTSLVKIFNPNGSTTATPHLIPHALCATKSAIGVGTAKFRARTVAARAPTDQMIVVPVAKAGAALGIGEGAGEGGTTDKDEAATTEVAEADPVLVVVAGHHSHMLPNLLIIKTHLRLAAATRELNISNKHLPQLPPLTPHTGSKLNFHQKSTQPCLTR